jgi:hypothetical protein
MGKPAEIEINKVLEHAGKMCEQGEDPFFISKALLNLHYRFEKLEDVYHSVEHFIYSGLGETEDARLMMSIRKYQEVDRFNGEESQDSLPL